MSAVTFWAKVVFGGWIALFLVALVVLAADRVMRCLASPARWLRVRWSLRRMRRKGPVPRDGKPLDGPEWDAFASIEDAVRAPSYDRGRPS